MAKARSRLSAIDLLPEECGDLVTWASQELAKRDRTQVAIYAEWKEKLIALQGEQGIGFDIPSFSAFNRHSIKLSQMTRRLEQTREIAASLYERRDATATEDHVTIIAAEAIKTLIFELLQAGGDAGISPKGAMELANALRAASAAQASSTNRRQNIEAEERAKKIEADFEKKADQVFKVVSRESGIPAERISQLRKEFLGVRETPKDADDKAKT